MTMFFALCVFMGLLQINENINLLKQDCEHPISNVAFSALELFWVFVVIYFFFDGNITFLERMACTIYIFYNIFGWCVGLIQFNISSEKGRTATPAWYLKINVVWATIFTLTSFYVLSALFI